jgi:primosomal protein N' (replication factor Y)
LIARVLPDIRAIDKTFDYLVPDDLVGDVRVGTMVRISLHGRRVGGWVVGLAETAGTTKKLSPIAKVTGWGPSPELVELSTWAAWRWAGRRSHFLTTASPPGAVRALPPAPPSFGSASPPSAAVMVIRQPPDFDPIRTVEGAARRGETLALLPSVDAASAMARRLRQAGHPVALVPRDWARAAAGGCIVVGARAGAWAPVPNLAAVVVVDAHDEAYTSESAPTWNAVEVAVERAKRAGVPCALLSPCPPLHVAALGRLMTRPRPEERAGWPALDIVDRTDDDPRTGLFSERLVNLVRNRVEAGGQVVCVLNRKGRARLLACATCGALARCERCEAAVEQDDTRLRCRRCGTERPLVCASCGGQRLKNLRAGVTRVREELEALAGVPVAEVTGDSEAHIPSVQVLVGTEAVLHRVTAPVGAVAFLDFDQELLAPRYRAAEEALVLLARAARLVGGRASGGRLLVQTRLPRHEVLLAALHADPGRVAEAEAARRAILGFPPISAMAVVSGAAAEEFVGALEKVDVMGPDDDRWLLRAPDHDTLCDALAAVPRPPGRLRIEVDPLRL